MNQAVRNLAILVGINNYQNEKGINPLKTPVNDANKLAQILENAYNYDIKFLLDDAANFQGINNLLQELKQGSIILANNRVMEVNSYDRILFYFAGHGIALDGFDRKEGPSGFLIPQDANKNDKNTFLPMQQLHDVLIDLKCRHLLVILDCCYAGAFRFSRNLVPYQKLYRQRYDRFMKGKAQQMLFSAAYDEKALDVLTRLGERELDSTKKNSPFAEVLFKALESDADIIQDGAITVSELYIYLENELAKITDRQTPGLCWLKYHEKGEYIFEIPGFQASKLENAPPIDRNSNPYRGLKPYEPEHSNLFFGRNRAIGELIDRISAPKKRSLTVVLGPSGSGKSSLVKAGLIPRLPTENWQIIAPMRPGKAPFKSLAEAVLLTTQKTVTVDREKIDVLSQELQANPLNFINFLRVNNSNPATKLLLTIDQFEELITLCSVKDKRLFLTWLKQLLAANITQLQVIITLRSDFEPQFARELLEQSEWMAAWYVVPPMTQDEFRDAIAKPATEKVLFFEPPDLIEQLINDVVQMPGALPLLSFTLSELYLKCWERWQEGQTNRVMTREDYQQLGGVIGSLTQRATEVYHSLIKIDSAYEKTIPHVMLRMVAISGELARRRVLEKELEFPEPENQRVKTVVQSFLDARLLVKGTNSEGQPYVEPAHDALNLGWDKLLAWKQEEQENLLLQRQLTPAAFEWEKHQESRFLWHANPRLDLLKRVLDSRDRWFNKIETEFVLNSIREKHKNTVVRWSLIAGAFVALSGFTATIFIQFQQTLLREKAATAENLLTKKPVDGLVMAIAAMGSSQSLLKPFLKPAFKSVQSSLFSAVETARERNRSIGHSSGVTSVAISRDGAIVVSGSDDKTVRLWNLQGKLLAPAFIGHTARITAVAISPNGQIIASGSSDNTVRLWNLQGQLLAPPFRHESGVIAVAFSPDGQKIFSGEFLDAKVRIWDLQGNLLAPPFNANQLDVATNSVAFSSNGDLLAAGISNGSIQLWTVQGKAIGKPFRTLEGFSEFLASRPDLSQEGFAETDAIAFSPDGQKIVSGGFHKTVELWDLQGNLLAPPFEHDDFVTSVAFSPDGKTIVSGSIDGTIRLWDLKGHLIAPIFRGHTSTVSAVIFNPNGKTIISAGGSESITPDMPSIISADNTVRVWDVESNLTLRVIRHLSGVNNIAISPDGKIIASTSSRHNGTVNTVQLWDLEGNAIAPPFEGHQSLITSVAFSPKGKTVLSTDADGNILLWDFQGNLVAPTMKHDSFVFSAAFSPNGEMIVSTSSDKTLRLWDLQGNPIGLPFKGHEAEVNTAAFSPDGQMIVSGSGSLSSHDNTVRLWDLKGNQIAPPFKGHGGPITSVDFSGDGKMILSGSHDKTARLWNLKGGLIVPPILHESTVASVAFSKDNQTFVTGSGGIFAGANTVVQLWDLQGNAIGQPLKHQGSVQSVAFSPNGNIIISGSDDKTVRLWAANWQEWLKIACDRLQDHPVLKHPESEAAQQAKVTCQKYAGSGSSNQ